MAPMYYNSDEEVKRIADALEEIAKQDRLGNILLANDGMFMSGELDAETYLQVIQNVVKEINTNG